MKSDKELAEIVRDSLEEAQIAARKLQARGWYLNFSGLSAAFAGGGASVGVRIRRFEEKEL